MKKIILPVMVCLGMIVAIRRAQSSTAIKAQHVIDTVVAPPDTTVAEIPQTFIHLNNSNKGHGYRILKKIPSGNPILNFGYSAFWWSTDSTFTNNAAQNGVPAAAVMFFNAPGINNNTSGNYPRFYNASNNNANTFQQAGPFLNYRSLFKLISNPSELNSPLNSAPIANGGDLVLTPGRVSLSLTLPAGQAKAITMDNTQFSVADAINNKGLVYASDYSATGVLDSLWIPNWGAVKRLVGAGPQGQPAPVYTFGNGITAAAANSYRLGGNFDNISLAGNSPSSQFLLGMNSGTSDSTTFLINNLATSISSVDMPTGSRYGIAVSIAGMSIAYLNNHDQSKSRNLHIDSAGTTYTDTKNHAGINYSSVNRALFTDTTLVDKKYVDSVAAQSGGGGVLAPTNGLQTSGTNSVGLGGMLTAPTSIFGSQSLEFISYSDQNTAELGVAPWATSMSAYNTTGSQANVWVSPDMLDFSYADSTGSEDLTINSWGLFVTDHIHNKGFVYDSHYNFTDPQQIPDKQYVDSVAAQSGGGGGLIPTNGLQRISPDSIGWGGTLTQNTTINTGSRAIEILSVPPSNGEFSGLVVSPWSIGMQQGNMNSTHTGVTGLADVTINQNRIDFSYLDSRGGEALNIDSLDGLTVIDNIYHKGFVYNSHYNFTDPQQIPDKQYVDSVAAQSGGGGNSLAPTNGLQLISSDSIGLGGGLTQNAFILTHGYSYDLIASSGTINNVLAFNLNGGGIIAQKGSDNYFVGAGVTPGAIPGALLAYKSTSTGQKSQININANNMMIYDSNGKYLIDSLHHTITSGLQLAEIQDINDAIANENGTTRTITGNLIIDPTTGLAQPGLKLSHSSYIDFYDNTNTTNTRFAQQTGEMWLINSSASNLVSVKNGQLYNRDSDGVETPYLTSIGAGSTYEVLSNKATSFSILNNTLYPTTQAVADYIANGYQTKLTGYTVATLPTGVVGMQAYVTDALSPASLSVVAGGGGSTVKVFYNGSNWVVQ